MIKLYADENGFSFAQYTKGQALGDSETFLGLKRNGTAQVIESCQLFKLSKQHIMDILIDYPALKNKLMSKALDDFRELTALRKEKMKKSPAYGLKKKKKEAQERIIQLA